MIFVLRFSNSGFRRATYPSSVVHTGVKSFGCENRIAHPLPIHSWNLIVPSVVSAVKSGTSSPIRNDMENLRCDSLLLHCRRAAYLSAFAYSIPASRAQHL